MKTLRAIELLEKQILFVENKKWKIDKVYVNDKLGNIVVFLGKGGHYIKFFNMSDVVVVE